MKWSVYAGRAARSQTKSKISSRGAEMTVETVTSRTRRAFYGCPATSSMPISGGGPGARAPGCHPLGGHRHNGEPPLAGVYPLGAHRLAALVGQRAEAELAEQPPRSELVEALAGQRGAVALLALVAG